MYGLSQHESLQGSSACNKTRKRNKILLLPDETRLKINGPWELRGYSYAYYAGDNYTRKSVTGYIVFNNGADITWRSRSQKTVILSVT